MAEDVIDHVETVGDLDEKPCVTVNLLIHGAGGENEDDTTSIDGYGTDADAIAALAASEVDGASRLHPSLPYETAEVIWHVRAEMARTVEDVLARRTRALLLDAKASIEAAPVVAAVMARELGRNDAWGAEQVRAYTALAQGYVFTHSSSMG
ncbi:hypothetical protein LZG03_00250 [Opitutaceae bacterium LMO-CP1]|nr:hypothetical protein [Opitutaceae bacterium LMO-M01]